MSKTIIVRAFFYSNNNSVASFSGNDFDISVSRSIIGRTKGGCRPNDFFFLKDASRFCFGWIVEEIPSDQNQLWAKPWKHTYKINIIKTGNMQELVQVTNDYKGKDKTPTKDNLQILKDYALFILQPKSLLVYIGQQYLASQVNQNSQKK